MEMYLFSLKQQILDPNNYYNKLTQNGHWDLTDVRLKQFLWNILESNISLENKKNFFLQNQLKKDIYEYNDILNLKLDWNKEHLITVPIGQKIIVNTVTKSPRVFLGATSVAPGILFWGPKWPRAVFGKASAKDLV